MPTLGEKLLAIRNEKGLLQEDVIAGVNHMFDDNISASMLSRWERDRGNPSLDNLKKLALYYKVSLDYLLGTDIGNQEGSKMERSDILAKFKPDLTKLCNTMTQLSEDNRNIVSNLVDSLLEKQNKEGKK